MSLNTRFNHKGRMDGDTKLVEELELLIQNHLNDNALNLFTVYPAPDLKQALKYLGGTQRDLECLRQYLGDNQDELAHQTVVEMSQVIYAMKRVVNYYQSLRDKQKHVTRSAA